MAENITEKTQGSRLEAREVCELRGLWGMPCHGCKYFRHAHCRGEKKTVKMTMSLLNAYEWYCNCPPSWKDSAYEKLVKKLRCEEDGSVWTAKGDSFENDVNRVLAQKKMFAGLMKPLNLLHGMDRQVWLDPLTVGLATGMQFTFRGKMDYFGIPEKPLLKEWSGKPVIYDLKTTSSNIKAEKYTESLQHVIYCLAMKVQRFAYFVCELPQNSFEPIDMQTIPVEYTRKGLAEAQELLIKKTSKLVSFLQDHNLWDDYFNKFNGGTT